MRHVTQTVTQAVLRLVAAVLLTVATIGAVHAQPTENPLRIGATLPGLDAGLYDVQSESQTALSNVLGSRATVFIFWSNECPWVDRYEDRVQSLREQFSGQGIRFVLVNANDADAFEQEGRAASAERARSQGYGGMRYLRDDTAALATALGAMRTPHVFVFDANRTLVYQGAIDDSPGSAEDVTNRYLHDALDALAAGESVSEPETKAFGCMIKLPR
ncbi:MAG: redoxin domain-containing protein [Longimonas sp.]|uniref:redoxin family protein n=1 Tax=Longimonas sp. TaxID=2039626 RepID=UPI00334B3D6C